MRFMNKLPQLTVSDKVEMAQAFKIINVKAG